MPPKVKKYRLPKSGYVLVYVGRGEPGTTRYGYAYEHRVVMEKRLGRPLRRGEVVHHKNGVRHDNRDKNLELMTHTKHAQHHNAQPDGLHPTRTRPFRQRALHLVLRGATIKAAAAKLGISVPSVMKLVSCIKEWPCPWCDRVFMNVRARGVHTRRAHGR